MVLRDWQMGRWMQMDVFSIVCRTWYTILADRLRKLWRADLFVRKEACYGN